MIAELKLGYSGIQAAFEIIKVLNATATQAQINEIKLELQGHLLAANQALTAAQAADAISTQRIRDLEQEIVKFKDWECQKKRYELKAVGVGALAFSPKPGMENGEPAHLLCTTCFEDRRRSFYQRQPSNTARTHLGIPTIYECQLCHSKIVPS